MSKKPAWHCGCYLYFQNYWNMHAEQKQSVQLWARSEFSHKTFCDSDGNFLGRIHFEDSAVMFLFFFPFHLKHLAPFKCINKFTKLSVYSVISELLKWHLYSTPSLVSFIREFLYVTWKYWITHFISLMILKAINTCLNLMRSCYDC